MKKLLCLFGLLLISFQVRAGDDPCAATVLSNNMTLFEEHTTMGLSSSAIPDPNCANYSGPDIWFSAIVPASGNLYIASKELTLVDAAMAVYTGSCNNLTLIDCYENDLCGNTEMPITSFSDLTPGETIFIRLWSEGVDGNFEIRVSETDLTPTPFQTVNSATYVSDECIRLTSASNNQTGCAWFPDQVDFSMPFTHSMVLNFGANNGGADGICLVYQANDLTQCGVGGEGIAAQGITNSVVIEFDTYQNAPLGDPALDHVAVNINGVMNHAASIAAPIVLGTGNIEDGMDHIVDFSWDPGTMVYQVFFDGTLYITGGFDFITNVFGGSPLAYWGYTSSTGGANNEHVVCPGFERFPHGVRDSVLVTICEGMSHTAGGAAQTLSGIYQDDFMRPNGCDSILVTELIVLPNSTFDTSAVICFGDQFELNGQMYNATGMYDQMLAAANTCDSTITISLEVLDPIASVNEPDTLTCSRIQVQLDGGIVNGGPALSFEWTGPGNFMSDEEDPWVSLPGVYTFRIIVTEGNLDCFSPPINIEVFEDLGFELSGEVKEQDCDSALIIINADPDATFLVSGPAGFQTISDSFYVFVSGDYILSGMGANGCTGGGVIPVLLDVAPEAMIVGDTINCNQPTINLQGNSNIQGGTYTWTLPDNSTMIGESIMTNQAGLHSLIISNGGACVGRDSFLVIEDLAKPTLMVEADSLDCNNGQAGLRSSSMNAQIFS